MVNTAMAHRNKGGTQNARWAKELETPALDRLLDVKVQHKAILEFLEWLGEQGVELHSSPHWPLHGKTDEALLAHYYDLDLPAIKADRAEVNRRLKIQERNAKAEAKRKKKKEGAGNV